MTELSGGFWGFYIYKKKNSAKNHLSGDIFMCDCLLLYYSFFKSPTCGFLECLPRIPPGRECLPQQVFPIPTLFCYCQQLFLREAYISLIIKSFFVLFWRAGSHHVGQASLRLVESPYRHMLAHWAHKSFSLCASNMHVLSGN